MKRDASSTHVLAFAVLAALLAASSARADAPGLPGTRRVYPTHRVVAREPFPDHVLVLCDCDINAKETRQAEFVTLEPGRPLLIEFPGPNDWQMPRRFGWYATLVIVLRADATGSAVEVANAALGGRIGGVTRHSFYARSDAPAWSGDRVTVDYEIRRAADGRLEVVSTDSAAIQCCLFPLILSAAAVSGGLYLAFRWRGLFGSSPPRSMG